MPEAKIKRGWGLRDTVLTLLAVVALAAIVVVPRVFFTMYHIPSASMVPTLMVGEYVAAENGAAQPHVGDVVFTAQPNQMTGRTESFVRRVLALPGERIAFRDGVPILDGVAARQLATRETGPEGERIVRETLGGRSYRVAYQSESSAQLRDRAEMLVPPGQVFLVGDARDNALDSRLHGPAPISSIQQIGGWIIVSPISGRAGHRIE